MPPPYIHQLLLCYDLTPGQGICVQYLSDSSTKSPRNIAQHSRVHRFLYLLHNIYWVNFRIRFSLSIFIHGFKKVHWSVCGLDKDWVISSEQVDESPQLIENLPFSIIWAEFSKLGSVTAAVCSLLPGDKCEMYWRRNLLFNTSNTGHRSPDIFYIFAELTLAALTFVGTGTAINIVVNADTTTISLNGSKREEDWL